MKKKIFAFFITVITVLNIFALASCSPPPELYEVYDRLVYLLEGSRPVNEIFFGEGLVSYNDNGGLYDDDEYNSTLEGTDIYMYYTEVLPSYKTADGKEITQYRSVNEIKAEAEKYYSSSYLNKVYPKLFVDDYYGDQGLGTRAKYLEIKNEETGKTTFCEYVYHSPVLTEENPATVYNYETMKIVEPSSGDTLIVEIQGYNKKYFDPESGEMKSGWHTVTLQFIIENGQWFLDGPSY